MLQLQQQYCSCSSSTLLNQFRISNYPCDNKWIAPQIIQFAAFTSFISRKSTAAAAAVLQLQQQHPFESIQIVYPCIPSLVIINELLPELFNLLPLPALCLEKVLQLQQQCCSCSSSGLLNQFRLSNYPCVPSLVIIYELLPELFNLLPCLMSRKSPAAAATMLQVQQQHPSESIQNFKFSLHTKFGDNKWITVKVGYCEIEGTEFLARYRRYSLLPTAAVEEFS